MLERCTQVNDQEGTLVIVFRLLSVVKCDPGHVLVGYEDIKCFSCDMMSVVVGVAGIRNT